MPSYKIKKKKLEIWMIFNSEKMKRFLLAYLLTIFAAVCTAQNHLDFMGVPMTGRILDFTEKLKEKGFSITSAETNVVFMKGIFTEKTVDVGICSSPLTNEVCRIMIFFEAKDSWSTLKTEYNDLKRMYDLKYTLDKEFHFFKDPYNEGDGYEMQAVRSDKCRYSSFYNAASGNIHLEISKLGSVVVVYEDSSNNSNKEQKETTTKIFDKI